MFFTTLARLLALLLFGLAILRISMAIYIATYLDADADAIARYLGSQRTTGEAIDQGTIWLIAAISLGTLGEISRTLQTSSKKAEVSE